MNIATEILNLRRNQFSSMTALLSAIERYWTTQFDEHVEGRRYAVFEAADMLLTNVAAHAAEAMNEPLMTRKTRRSVLPFRRKPRRSDPGRLHQRRLFA